VRLKLDENLGRRAADILGSHGHDVQTVLEQGMSRAPDEEVIRVCQSEQRCLVTLDLGFGNPLVFDPAAYSGIAVLRLPGRPSHQDIVDACHSLAAGLQDADIRGKLWIVQRGRIREHQSEDRS
jgi:hypothetical protein